MALFHFSGSEHKREWYARAYSKSPLNRNCCDSEPKTEVEFGHDKFAFWGGGGGSFVSTKTEVEFGHDKFAFRGGRGGGSLVSTKTEVEFGHDLLFGGGGSLVSTKTEVEFGHDKFAFRGGGGLSS